MTELKKDFDCNFQIELVDELPFGPHAYCYPGAVEGAVVDGVAVLITPTDAKIGAWLGTFAKGHLSLRAGSQVGICPDKKSFYVISRGESYLVESRCPENWSQLSIQPVMGVVAIPNKNILLFYSADRILAWGENGLLWKTDSISFDGIKILNIDSTSVTVEVWDAPTRASVTAIVDLESGSTTGATGPRSLKAAPNE